MREVARAFRRLAQRLSAGFRRAGTVVASGLYDIKKSTGTPFPAAYSRVLLGPTSQISCPCDSGGPVLRQLASGAMVVAGIASTGVHDPSAPRTSTSVAFYTSAAAARTWVLNTASSL